MIEKIRPRMTNEDLAVSLRVLRNYFVTNENETKYRSMDVSGLEYVIEKIEKGEWSCEDQAMPITRSDILDAAKKCVCGQREQDYGTPESNFRLIANLWNAYLDDRDDDISPTDVAMMMGLMKIARIRNGGGTGDSFVDLAGYAACGGEINNNIKFINYVRGLTAKEMEKVGTEVQKAIISGLEGDKICGNCKHFYKNFSEEPCTNCSNCVRNADALLWEAKEDTNDKT